MKTIKINETDFIVKDKLSDFNLGEFEKFTQITNNPELDEIDKYSQIFQSFGNDSELLDDLTTQDFFTLIKEFLSSNDLTDVSTISVKEIEVNGRTYVAYQDEFKIRVKEMKLIESFIKKNKDLYLAEIIAVIFKDSELTETEHYTDAHIRHKAKLFRQHVNAEIVVPYLTKFSEIMSKSLS